MGEERVTKPVEVLAGRQAHLAKRAAIMVGRYTHDCAS
jgi:hypothetical protein